MGCILFINLRDQWFLARDTQYNKFGRFLKIHLDLDSNLLNKKKPLKWFWCHEPLKYVNCKFLIPLISFSENCLLEQFNFISWGVRSAKLHSRLSTSKTICMVLICSLLCFKLNIYIYFLFCFLSHVSFIDSNPCYLSPQLWNTL